MARLRIALAAIALAGAESALAQDSEQLPPDLAKALEGRVPGKP
ncbi:hypothetical protein [Sphingomonas sp.]|nr:hypothetical protein [Sphingomonas sp.]